MKNIKFEKMKAVIFLKLKNKSNPHIYYLESFLIPGLQR